MGITCSSRHLHWRATSCQSYMASKFNGTTSHWNGGHQNLNIIAPPHLPTTWWRPAAGVTNLWYHQQYLLLARFNHLRQEPLHSCTIGALWIGSTNTILSGCNGTPPHKVSRTVLGEQHINLRQQKVWYSSSRQCIPQRRVLVTFNCHMPLWTGHVKKGEITNTLADEVVGAIRAGVTEMVNKPHTTSPLGKCKWRGQGQGGGPTNPPKKWLGVPVKLEEGGGAVQWTLSRGGEWE